MPSREATALGPCVTSASTITTSQWSAGYNGRAASPSSPGTPAGSSHHPPNRLRAAEALPRRARAERAVRERSTLYARAPAAARAAKPEALDASPEALGKWLCDVTSAKRPGASGARPARSRTRSRNFDTFSAARPDCRAPSRCTTSASRAGSCCTSVSVTRASRVSDTLGTAGRLSAVSHLPQYLARAMLARARALPRLIRPP
jgi:hypothetical protein